LTTAQQSDKAAAMVRSTAS